MKAFRKRLTILATVALIMALPACSGDAGSGGESSDEPIRVVVAAALSGPLAELGKAGQNSLDAAAEVINSEGGILGRDVEIEYVDDKGEASATISALQGAISPGDLPDLVVPGSSSIEVLPALPVLAQLGVLSLTPSSSPLADDPSEYPLSFNVTLSARDNVHAMLGWIQEAGYESVGVLYADTAVGQAAADLLASDAPDAGLTVDMEKLKPESLDATPELARLEAKDPELLVMVGGNGATPGVMLESRKTLGWDVPVLGEPYFAYAVPQDVLEDASLMEGVTMTTEQYRVVGSDVQSTAEFETFISELDKRSSEKVFSLNAYAVPYHYLMVYRAAAEKAESTDPEKVAEALVGMTDLAEEVPGWFLSTGGSFSEESHTVTTPAESYAFVKIDGRVNGSDRPAR
jgi:branched-chain amino acid transport system substrate-binding protein